MRPHILKKQNETGVEVAIPAAVLVSCRIEDPRQERELVRPLDDKILLNILAATGAGFMAERFYSLEEYVRAVSLPWLQLAKILETGAKERILRLGQKPAGFIRAAKPALRHFVLPLLLLGEAGDAEGLYFETQMPDLLEAAIKEAGFPGIFLEIYPAVLHRSQVAMAAAMEQVVYTITRFEEGEIDVDRPPPSEWINILQWPQALPLPVGEVGEEEYEQLFPLPVSYRSTDIQPLAGINSRDYALLRRKLASKLNQKGWTLIPVETDGLKEWLKENNLEDTARNRVKFYVQSLDQVL